MAPSKTFVGFGFGPIQSGLFLLEAQASGNFRRYVVSEIDTPLVEALRSNADRCTVNVAKQDGIVHRELDAVELYNPLVPAGRKALVEAIAEADEMATALPSVNTYASGGGNSVLSLLADGLGRRQPGHPAIVYTAENNNRAAEILARGLAEKLEGCIPRGFQALDTVIGKMSGVIHGHALMEGLGLQPVVPGMDRAILVEEFNRILVSRVRLEGFERGIRIFEEKEDLDPFEEAKLYGHNAIHALMGYLAALRGYTTIAEAGRDKLLVETARKAFHKESGAGLVRKYRNLGDQLFTPEGFSVYAEDLLERMVCPYLHDLVERVARDPVRKLGWHDRLYGTIRIALAQDVEPDLLAMGAAAGLVHLLRSDEDRKKVGLPAVKTNQPIVMNREETRDILLRIWQPDSPAPDEADALAGRTAQAMERLRTDGWLPDIFQ